MSPDDRKRFVQIVGQVLIADGILGDAEREYLDRVMDELEMPAEERKTALSGINMDDDVAAKVEGLSAEVRAKLLTAVEAAADADGVRTRAEAQHLDELRKLLA